jgi:hypothetical protein
MLRYRVWLLVGVGLCGACGGSAEPAIERVAGSGGLAPGVAGANGQAVVAGKPGQVTSGAGGNPLLANGGAGGSGPRAAGVSGTASGPAGAGSMAASDIPAGACQASMDRVRITEVDLGTSVVNNEDEVNLKPLVIAPMTSAGARVAFMGSDGMLRVAQLDASDHVTGSITQLVGYDFGALLADDAGGVVLLTRPAQGSGDKHCGTLSNLCGSTASLPSTQACFDMYLVRFDGTNETWATQLTQSSAARPPYLTSATDTQRVVYIWQQYAHHGRLAYDGMNYAAYYGAAISVSQKCVNSDSALANAVNIHQGDELRVVGPTGTLSTSRNAFDWGCSHSGFERVVWDPAGSKFVPVCKTDNNNRIAIAPNYTTVLPVDLAYADLGNLVVGTAGGIWLTTSNIGAGQPAAGRGLAQVLLLHFAGGMADKTITLSGDATRNQRAPHLAAYGKSRMLAAWESSSAAGDLSRNDKNRKFHLQVLNASSGELEGPPLDVVFQGNRYQDLVAFPDGSVAFTAPGSSATKIKILRVLPCAA